jgi:hypothetical protein
MNETKPLRPVPFAFLAAVRSAPGPKVESERGHMILTYRPDYNGRSDKNRLCKLTEPTGPTRAKNLPNSCSVTWEGRLATKRLVV